MAYNDVRLRHHSSIAKLPRTFRTRNVFRSRELAEFTYGCEISRINQELIIVISQTRKIPLCYETIFIDVIIL